MRLPHPIVEFTDSLIKIAFDYDRVLLDKVKSIPRARWVSGERVWTVPYSEASLDLVKAVFPDMVLAKSSAEKIEKQELSELELEELKYLPKVQTVEITDFEFKTKPFMHQRVSFGFARALPAAALFLEQGLGKAKLAIDLATWRYRKKQVQRVLIGCPASVMGQWVDELKIHGHADFSKSVVLEGAAKSRQKTLEALPVDFAGFLIINYEGLLPLREYFLRQQLSANKLFDMIVFDETSRLKHAQSQRSKIAWRLGTTVKYRLALTGTPITQSIEDIFSQYRFLQPSIFGPYATAFRSQYLIMGGFENREIKGYKNVASLVKKIYSVAIRFTKDKCVDLPPKIFERREVRMDPESSAKYVEFEKRCVAEFSGKTVSAQLVMTKLMKLSQLTGGFIYEQGPDGKKIGTICLPKNPKLNELNDLLDEILPKKVIIWCRFVQELAFISKLLKAKKVDYVSISGSVSSEDRNKARDRFQNDSKCKVFLGQTATAGFGITLTKAEVVVYYSNSYSYEERIQSEDRCHRIGLDHSVTYVDLICTLVNGRKTIDYDILEIKDCKARLANEVSSALMQKMVSRSTGKSNFAMHFSSQESDVLSDEETF